VHVDVVEMAEVGRSERSRTRSRENLSLLASETGLWWSNESFGESLGYEMTLGLSISNGSPSACPWLVGLLPGMVGNIVPLIGNKPPLRTGADGVMISRVSVCGAEKSQLKESTVFERMD
jgi:hypothetical protein